MLADTINTTIGIVLGLITGFYFERRSTKAALQQNRELEAELSALRTSVYSVGAKVPSEASERKADQDLPTAVLSRARSVQDAEGRLTKTALTSYFFAQGHRSSDVDEAIQHLREAGVIREDGKWLEVA